MPKIDLPSVEKHTGCGYPSPYDEPCRNRVRQRIGRAAGLTDFGVNVLRLAPGTWSSQRHWHSHEDELVWVLEGEVTLVEDGGDTVLRAGDCAGFKAGVANGHHLVNRSDRDAVVLEIGSSKDATDVCQYPDSDLIWAPGGYTHRDGTPY